MVDSKAGSNLLYLPLDKLLQQGAVPAAAAPAAPAATTTAPSATPSDPTGTQSVDIRSRDGTRNREREGR